MLEEKKNGLEKKKNVPGSVSVEMNREVDGSKGEGVSRYICL